MAKSKFFRVATEGDTTDGRKIERVWLQQMADAYDRNLYAARVWLEHMRGLYPDSTFRAYGDVLALEARPVEDGKLALFAQIDPTPDLVAMNKARQKLYSSLEVDQNFARRGHAYLMGLAVTDSPASLGTEMLQFAASAAEKNPLAARKVSPDNLFTAATPITLELEDDMSKPAETKSAETKPAEEKTLLSRVKALIAGPSETPPTPEIPAFSATDATQAEAAFGALAEAFAKQSAAFATARTEDATARAKDAAAIKELTDKVTALSTGLQEVSTAFDAFKAQLDASPAGGTARPPAAGGQADADLGI